MVDIVLYHTDLWSIWNTVLVFFFCIKLITKYIQIDTNKSKLKPKSKSATGPTKWYITGFHLQLLIFYTAFSFFNLFFPATGTNVRSRSIRPLASRLFLSHRNTHLFLFLSFRQNPFSPSHSSISPPPRRPPFFSFAHLQWHRNRVREDRTMRRSEARSSGTANLSSKILNTAPASDLPPPRKLPKRRRSTNPIFTGAAAGARSRRDGGASGGRRSGPTTPLLRWNFDDADRSAEHPPEFGCGKVQRKHQNVAGEAAPSVSARKLAAALWQLQLPEASGGFGKCRRARLRFEVGLQDPCLFFSLFP